MTSSSNTDTDKWIKWIENGIAEDYVNYHDYYEFKNIQRIGYGAFDKLKFICYYLDNLDNEHHDVGLNYLLILEYADSGTLRNYLKDNFDKLDWNIKLQFAIQIADAVSCMHSKDIIHRDLVSILFF